MGKKEVIKSPEIGLMSKVAYHNNIEPLSQILRSHLKDSFHIHHQLTFEEIKEAISRKHMENESKKILIEICDNFTHLEYRPKKPSKEEISRIKVKLRKILRLKLAKIEVKKQSKIVQKFKSIKERKEKHLKIKDNLSGVKDKIKNSIIKKIHQKRKSLSPKDKEIFQIKKFVTTSQDLSMSITEIKKDLKDMGFEHEKIDFVIKQL